MRRYDPSFYDKRVTLTLSDQDSYDLATGAVKLMGPTATLAASGRLASLTRVQSLDGSGNWQFDYEPAASIVEMQALFSSYFLEATILYFSGLITGSVRLIYTPISAVDFTKITAGQNEEIDELDEFHHLIALYAYGHYAITDGASNKQIAEQIQRTEASLRRHLSSGRNPGASDHVSVA